MHEKIEKIEMLRISNIDYEYMTVGEKLDLIDKYRMISLNDPDFEGHWLLIPKE